MLEDPRLVAVASQHGATPAALALAWAVRHGVAVIPKSAHPERVRRAAAPLARSLAPVATLTAAPASLGPTFYPCRASPDQAYQAASSGSAVSTFHTPARSAAR